MILDQNWSFQQENWSWKSVIWSINWKLHAFNLYHLTFSILISNTILTYRKISSNKVCNVVLLFLVHNNKMHIHFYNREAQLNLHFDMHSIDIDFDQMHWSFASNIQSFWLNHWQNSRSWPYTQSPRAFSLLICGSLSYCSFDLKGNISDWLSSSFLIRALRLTKVRYRRSTSSYI